MHICFPNIEFRCKNCAAVWCYNCACDIYFAKLVIRDKVTISRVKRVIGRIHCANCHQYFDLQGQGTLSWMQQRLHVGDFRYPLFPPGTLDAL